MEACCFPAGAAHASAAPPSGFVPAGGRPVSGVPRERARRTLMVSHRWQVLGLSLAAALISAAPARGANWATAVVNYSAGFTYPSPDPNNFSFVPPTGGVDAAYASAT